MAGTEVLNGTQVPLDAAYILNLLTGNKLTERGQDIGWNDRLLTYYERERDAKQQWETDAARVGIEAANLNFNQRQADASNELQRQSGVLGRDELNYRQRSDLAQQKTGILNMLNSRRGPGNWVKYGSLLNGLDAPTPERSATIDPFKILEGLVRESEAFSERIPSVNQPHSVSMGARPESGAPSSLLGPAPAMRTANTGGSGGGGGGGGSLLNGAGQAWGTQGYATNNPPTSIFGGNEGAFSGIRNEDVAGLTAGQNALKVTGTAGPSYGRDYTNFRVSNPATGQAYGPDDEIAGGTNVWLTRLGNGGQVDGGEGPAMAITGDGRGKKPGKNSELAMALKGSDGDPILKVFSPEQTRALLERVRGLPRAASGGTYGTGNTDQTLTYETYSPEDLANQPFIKSLFGGKRKSAFRGFGSKLSNPSIGIDGAPTLLNLQAFAGLDPSEKDATEELYGTGLEVDFRDLIEQARRAAPFGRMFGNAGYGF